MELEGPLPTATATYLNQTDPVRNVQTHFFKMRLNIVIPPTPKFSIW
jgi:hypothetical protein